MRLSSEDLQRRRPVWEALSNLFLDTELQEVDLRHIAGTLAGSPYTADELESILYHEVLPICIWNLRSPAGEWAGIDRDWLQEQIVYIQKHPWRAKLMAFFGGRAMIQNDWHKVLQFLRQVRDASL